MAAIAPVAPQVAPAHGARRINPPPVENEAPAQDPVPEPPVSDASKDRMRTMTPKKFEAYLKTKPEKDQRAIKLWYEDMQRKKLNNKCINYGIKCANSARDEPPSPFCGQCLRNLERRAFTKERKSRDFKDEEERCKEALALSHIDPLERFARIVDFEIAVEDNAEERLEDPRSAKKRSPERETDFDAKAELEKRDKEMAELKELILKNAENDAKREQDMAEFRAMFISLMQQQARINAPAPVPAVVQPAPVVHSAPVSPVASKPASPNVPRSAPASSDKSKEIDLSFQDPTVEFTNLSINAEPMMSDEEIEQIIEGSSDENNPPASVEPVPAPVIEPAPAPVATNPKPSKGGRKKKN